MFSIGDSVYVAFGGAQEEGIIVYKHTPEEGYPEGTYTVEIAGCVVARYHESEIRLTRVA